MYVCVFQTYAAHIGRPVNEGLWEIRVMRWRVVVGGGVGWRVR